MRQIAAAISHNLELLEFLKIMTFFLNLVSSLLPVVKKRLSVLVFFAVAEQEPFLCSVLKVIL